MTTDSLRRVYKSKHGDGAKNLGKAIARELHFTGREGGWIYHAVSGNPVCQGYASLAIGRYHARYNAELGGWVLPEESLDAIAKSKQWIETKLAERETEVAS